ncbi:hypothetical protein NQ318_000218 [Aromia moschata]|uniref:Gustatory receptor n=1 Tax=Aromia moschata TaxID=1265417 RepID=A0AAV8YJ74_9CUCU|nr:hypothetical protein NQ318_000218 [Aromia moschata]
MVFYDYNSDIRYIFDLIKLSVKLAIIPPLEEAREKNNNFKYYSLTFIAITVLGNAFRLYGLVVYFIPISKGTSIVLGVVLIIGSTLMSIVTILVAMFNRDTWITFINMFKYIDHKLNKGQVMVEGRNLLKVEIMTWHVIILCIFGYDAYVWYSSYGWTLFRFSLFRYINYYHCVMSILVVHHFAKALRARFKRINGLLVKSNDLRKIIKRLIPKTDSSHFNNLKCINDVTDYYLFLSELVDMFNKLFGWQIFFMTEILIVMLLELMNSFMLAIDFTQVTTDAHHDLRTIFFLVALSVVLILFHAQVVLYCEDVNEESRRTLAVCYNLQQAVDPHSHERKELIILSDVVNLLNTGTNAAGFYFINRSLISRIFAYLFSYSIVLIQFNKQT